jgi:hypothetical protein
MKYAKILGLLAVAAAALMAFAGTASATTITAGGVAYTNTIAASAENHVVLDNPIAKIECASSVTGKVESHGAGLTAKGNISALSFTGCTNSWHVTVVTAGSLEIHNISGTKDGTLTSSGATVESTRFGITCRYATSNTHIGRVTATPAGAPEHATLDISAAIPFHGGSGLCGGGATTWTGSYKVNTPTNLHIDA